MRLGVSGKRSATMMGGDKEKRDISVGEFCGSLSATKPIKAAICGDIEYDIGPILMMRQRFETRQKWWLSAIATMFMA